MIHDVPPLPPSKLRVVPLPIPVPLQRIQSLSRKTRADLITQYASQRKGFAEKSSAACGGIDVKADTARCYWPGQPVETLITVPKQCLEACFELRFELKGVINTHTYRTTGRNTRIQMWTETLFQRAVSVKVGDDGLPTETVKNHPSILFDQMPSSAESNGAIEWACTFVLPERAQSIEDGTKDGQRKLVNLPPTFRDDSAGYGPGAGGVSTYVAYIIKVTGHVKTKFRMNLRAWIPILVLPFAEAPPVLSKAIPAALGSLSGHITAPEDWLRCDAKIKLQKYVLFDQGSLEIEIALPKPVHIPFGTRVPFIIRVRAYANSRESLEDHGANGVPLPELPLTGAGEKHPVFLLRRLEHCSASGRVGVTVPAWKSRDIAATRSRQTHVPCEIQWGMGHVPGRSGSSTSATDVVDEDWSSLLSLGHTWTEAHLVEEGAETDGSEPPDLKGKGKSTKRWQREACVTGTLLPWIPPCIMLPKLQVTYMLGLTWTLKGVGNSIKMKLMQWRASSGMSAPLVEKLSIEEISRRIAGDKYELLAGQRELEEEDDQGEEHRLGEVAVVEDYEEEDDVEECLPQYERHEHAVEAALPPASDVKTDAAV